MTETVTGTTRDQRRKPLEEYNMTVMGIIASAVIIVVVAGILLLGQLPIGKTQLHAHFAQAAQLRVGDQVSIAGVEVGEVKSLKLAGDHVDVGFTVRDGVRIGEHATAEIKLTTILGSRYIALTPVGEGLPPGNLIPIENTIVPYDLQNTLADATTTFETLDADRIVESTRVLTESLQGVPAELPQALTNIKSLADVVASRRDQMGQLLRSTDSVTALLREQKSNLGVLVLQGRSLFGDLANRRAALNNLFASITVLVARTEEIVRDEPAITSLVDALHELTDIAARNDATLRDLLQTAPITVRNVANIAGSGNQISLFLPAGIGIDSWMCALSVRAVQFNLTQYFEDCE